MSLTITDPSFDKVYTMYAWRDNNIRFVLTQGEGATGTDGTISHVKVAKFQLRDDRGIIDLTSCEVLLALTRPDGSEDLLACSSASGEAAQGIISCPITASATAIAGQAVGEIRVLSANSGNPTGIIKFFGVHFQIYEGVSDDAAEQSTQFSALTAELQKVALLTPEGTAEMDDTLEHGGTNPVASGIIYDYLQGNYRQISFAHENNESSYDDGGVYIDDATDIKKMYYVKNSNGARVGILFCVQTLGYNYGTQVKINAYGNITIRVKTQESGEADYTWKSWTPAGTTRNIQDGAVTTPKLADGAVTSAKIGSGEVKTTNVNDGSITTAKLHSGVIDSTLSTQGAAAEAKTTGHHINVLTDRETALDGIVSQEWEIGMRSLVNGVETWSGTSTSRMSTKPGTYIRFNKDDLIVMKKTMDYQFLVVYSTDNGSTWTSTPNRYLPYSILDDSIGWICIKKTSGTFTEEEMQSVVNNYFFILRKGTGEIKKNALLSEALSIASGSFDRSEIIDSKYGFTYKYVSQGATQAASTELLLPEFSASAGDVFAIKASVSVDYPDMYSNIGVRIHERDNGNTVKTTDITDISDTIIYTVSKSNTDTIHIRGLLLANEGDITISHYEIFDYKISVVKKLPGEIEELLTEAGDIWEV